MGILSVSRTRAEPCPPLQAEALVVAGSTAIKPLVREVAKVLAATESASIYYAGLGSCLGVELIVEGKALQEGTLSTWNAAGDETSCELLTGTAVVDIGVSDVFPGSCLPLANGLPSNVADFLGPVQTMVFAVPQASQEQSISAEAAYYVYGFGAESGVSPWTEESFIFQRNASSGTQTMIGLGIGVPAVQFRGTETSGSGDLLERLLRVPREAANSAIGILSASHVEQNRSTVRPLAFQDFGATCATLPNRTVRSREKFNVRHGSYPIWGPVHLMTTVDAERRPADPLARRVIGFVDGSLPAPGDLDLIALQADEGVVPQCAMRVERDLEMGPLSPFVPSQPCSCAYEEAANGVTECAPCQTTVQCGERQACSFGYCEDI